MDPNESLRRLEAFERFEAIANDPGVEYVELLHGKPFGCLWTIRERTEEDLKERQRHEAGAEGA